jgi:hypothetical protein
MLDYVKGEEMLTAKLIAFYKQHKPENIAQV